MGWVNLITLVRANPLTQKEKPASTAPHLDFTTWILVLARSIYTLSKGHCCRMSIRGNFCSQARSVPMSPAGCGVGMHFLKQRVHCAEDHVPHLRVAGNGEVRCSLYDEVGDDRCVLRIFNADILTCQKHQNTPSVKYSNRLYITWHGGISDGNAVQQDG